MFKIFVTFKCYEGKREEFTKRVRDEGIYDAILAEDGCNRYDYYYSEKNNDEILLIEEWESQKHQQVHLETPHMARLREFKDEYVKTTEICEF